MLGKKCEKNKRTGSSIRDTRVPTYLQLYELTILMSKLVSRPDLFLFDNIFQNLYFFHL